jgi:hypothetical protein
MKRILRVFVIGLGCAIASLTLSCKPASDFSLAFSFTGPSAGSNTVYAVWIEDENGNNIQNVYVCDREASLVGLFPNLNGDALPNWLKKKYPQHKDIAGVTGASKQAGLSVTRGLSIGTARRFRVVFEIDRSTNSNAYFIDRPAFTYSSGLIDLDNLEPSYSLSFSGWMSNKTTDAPYGQQPNPSISGFEQYKLMTDPAFVQDSSGSTADMVSSAQAVITAN